jgi:hypothetical protein
MPRKLSQPAWNRPQSLKANGISVGDVKNQNIFMPSPNSQLAKTESLNPLQDRDRALAKICGRGRIASIESPTYPISEEYAGYSEWKGARTSSPMVRMMNKYSKNCQYLEGHVSLCAAKFDTSSHTVLATSIARSRTAAASQKSRHVRQQTASPHPRPSMLVMVGDPGQF